MMSAIRRLTWYASLLILGCVGIAVASASQPSTAMRAAGVGVLSGKITGSDGAPMRAIFVRAEHSVTKTTTIVLSDNLGRYVMDALPTGSYSVSATAVGFTAAPRMRTDIRVAEGASAVADFVVAARPVRWDELTRAQASVLLPEAPGRETFLRTCMNCHGMSRFVGRFDQAGWRAEIAVMQAMTTQNLKVPASVAEPVSEYLAAVFGPESSTPPPSDSPTWAKIKPVYPDDALNIVYVDFPLNLTSRDEPGVAQVDATGTGDMWFEIDNGVGRLVPATGKVTAFRIPGDAGGFVHDVLSTPDGAVWGTVTGRGVIKNRLARFDTRKESFEVFDDLHTQPVVPQVDAGTPIWGSPKVVPDGMVGTMRKHTPVYDYQGNIWSSGRPLTRFDIKTKTYTTIEGAPDTYGLTMDATRKTAWFTEFNAIEYGKLCKVDVDTGKVTKYAAPDLDGIDGRPRRVKVDSQGNVWVAQYFSGAFAMFDPKAEHWYIYKLPGLYPTPYGFGLDKDENVWGVSTWTDSTMRLDRATSKITMYPSPYVDRSTRDLTLDADGHLWYGDQVEHRIGYFYLRPGQ